MHSLENNQKTCKTWATQFMLMLLFLTSLVTTAKGDPVLNDSSYYEISTADELKWFAEKVNSGDQSINGVLTADIDLSTLDGEYWTPIGLWSGATYKFFKGKFNGQNHVITGLVLRKSAGSGLFGITQGATISNVVVNGAQMKSTVDTEVASVQNGIAPLCGLATDGTLIENCHSKLTNILYLVRDSTEQKDINFVGGIVGELRNSTVVGCSANGIVRTDGRYVGGIAGAINVGLAKNCSFTAYDEGNSVVVGIEDVGGIAGLVQGRSIENAIVGCTVAAGTRIKAISETSDSICGRDTLLDEPGLWDGYYEIYTANQLKWLASNVNGGNQSANAKLMNDINMAKAGSFTPIGSSDKYFSGIFDGQGFTIDSLSVGDQKYAGLFGYVQDGAIRNVTLNHPTVSTTSNYGGCIAGFVTRNGGTIEKVVENCHVKNATLDGLGGKADYVGGIVGKADMSSVVSDCSFQGTIKPHNKEVGGIVGELNSGAKIYNSIIVGPSTVWGDNYVGGVVGYMTDNATLIDNCYTDQSAGEVTVHASDNNYSGLIRGYDKSGSTTNTKYNEGNLQYEFTGKKITVGDTEASEMHITGVAATGKGTYYAIVDIGSSANYFTTEIENLQGVEELSFWDNNSNLAGTTACGWINMKIADYAFDSSFKSLKMCYKMFAGDDHTVMLRPSDVYPAGDNMLANSPNAKIYVDAEYYDEFCTDALWGKYKKYIVPTTSMRTEDVNAEYGARYAYDRNRDNTGTVVKVDNGSIYGSSQVHVIGADDNYINKNENTLWIYQDIGQTYDFNTNKIWASSFNGKDNIKQVRFQQVTKSANSASQDFNIAIGDSAFANCKNLEAFNVALFSDNGYDHVEFIHPSQMPIGKGLFSNSTKVKIYVPRDLLDEFRYDTQYGWGEYKDIIEAGDFGSNDWTEDGVIYSYFTSEDGKTRYTNKYNQEMEKIVASWKTMYANFSPGKVLEYNNSSKIKYMMASGIDADKINNKDGEMRLYCDIGECAPNHYKTIALSGSGFQNQTSIKKIVFQDIVANNYNTVTDLTFVIPDKTFSGCSNLKELNMFYYVTRGENNYTGIKPSQVFIGKNVFDGVDKAFRIVVQPEYYHDFITDANWSQYKDYIVAADYLPTDNEPLVRDLTTYDYVSKSLNTMSTSDITRLQSSGYNWILPGIIIGGFVTGGIADLSLLEGSAMLNTIMAFLAPLDDVLPPLIMAAEIASFSSLVVAKGVESNTTPYNYIVNRTKKNYSRPATWKMHGLWIRTEKTTSASNMYLSKVGDEAIYVKLYNDPGENGQDYRTIGIGRTAFHNKTKLERVYFQDRYGTGSESLNSMMLALPDSCFAGCTNLELLDLVIRSSGDGFDREIGLTPDNFIPYGDIFAGLDKSKIKIRVSADAYPEFIKDDYWKQYKGMYKVDEIEEKEKQDEWKCKYSLASNNNTIPLRTQSNGHDIEHTYIYGPGSGLAKTGLAALINDFGSWNNYKLDYVKRKAFYGNSDLKTLDITDTHTNVADVYTDFDISLMDSAFADCKNFENFNIIYQVTDGDNHTESIKPSQITLADGVFDGCDKLRLKFCLDQESAFLADSAWAKYKDKFRPCFFEPRDEKVADILLSPYRFKTDLNSGTKFKHVDATRPNPEDLKSLFKGKKIQMFDEFRAFGCCGLKTVYNGMFADCTSLQTIVLPDSITTIETDAFKNCSLLYKLAIPAKVTSIQENAFTGSSIKEFTVSSNVPANIDAEKAFAGLGSDYIIYVNDNVVDTYRTKWAAVADHINGIGQRRGLKVVKLTEPGTLAEKLGLTYYYTDNIFYNNHLYGNYAQFDSLRVIGPVDGRDIGVIRYLGGRDVEFNTATPGHLTYLDLYEADLKSEGKYEYNRAYYNNEQPSLRIEAWTDNYIQSDNEVSSFMFWGLDNLKTLILPRSATKIKVGAFEHCTNLQTLVIGENMKDIANSDWRERYVALSTPNKVALVMLGNSVPETAEDAFIAASGTHWANRNDQVDDYAENNTRFAVTIVPYDAVKSYSSDVAYSSTSDSILVNFEDAELVKSLKANHIFSPLDLINTTDITGFFHGNKYIRKFNELYYSAVTTLGDNTLTGMAGMTEVTLPVNLGKITAQAFKGCSSLERINAYGARIPELEANAFVNLPTDFVIMVREGQEDAYRAAWPEYANHIQGYREANLNIREITLTKPNTLADSLNATITMDENLIVAVGGSFSNLQGLKINGPIGGKDLALIRYLGGREPDWNNPVYLTNLKYLDLYDAELRADDYYFMLKGDNRKIEKDNEVPKDMLWNCDHLETVILPRTATKLNYEACYDMASLKRLVIGDNVTYIDDDALGGNDNLENIIFLCSSAPEFDGDAFTDNSSGDIRKIAKAYVRPSLVYNYSLDEEVTTHFNQITTGFNDIETFRAFGSKAIASEDDVPSITTIDGWFDNFAGITSLEMLSKSKIVNIGKNTVNMLGSLQNIALPSTLSTIADGAFTENKNLHWLDLSECESLKDNVDKLGVNTEALVYVPKTFGESSKANVVYNNGEELQCAEYNITTSHDYDVPKAFTAQKVTLGRNYEKGKFATLTLPFSADKKPAEFSFFSFDTDSTRNGRAYFSPTSAIEANVPYVVRARKNGQMTFSTATNIPVTPVSRTSTRANGYTLFGNLQTITAKNANEQKILAMDDNAVWNVVAAEAADVQPFTAYMMTNTSAEATANIPSEFNYKHYYIGENQYNLEGDGSEADPYYCANFDLKDGAGFRSDEPFITDQATYSHTMANKWGTLCLPFAVETANFTDSKFYALENVSSDLITLSQLDGTIDAGTPVLVYSTTDLNITASNANVVTSPADGEKASGYQLVGSFIETEVPDDGYIITKDKFWLTSDLKKNAPAKAVKIKGMRAWLKPGSESTETKAPMLGFSFDGTTAIDTVNSLTEGTAEIYDIEGRRTDRLQKGLNIVKTGKVTKKIMVK